MAKATAFQATPACETKAGPGMARIDAAPGKRKNDIVVVPDTSTTCENNIVVIPGTSTAREDDNIVVPDTCTTRETNIVVVPGTSTARENGIVVVPGTSWHENDIVAVPGTSWTPRTDTVPGMTREKWTSTDDLPGAPNDGFRHTFHFTQVIDDGEDEDDEETVQFGLIENAGSEDDRTGMKA